MLTELTSSLAGTALLGLALGFIGVGLPTLRTMKVIEGKPMSSFIIGLLSACSLFIFTNMVVLKNYPFMAANALGAAFAVAFLAYKNKKRVENEISQ